MKAQSSKIIQIKPMDDSVHEVNHCFRESIPFTKNENGTTFADNPCQLFLKKVSKDGNINVIGTIFNHNMSGHVNKKNSMEVIEFKDMELFERL